MEKRRWWYCHAFQKICCHVTLYLNTRDNANTCRAAVDSSLGKESIKTSTSLAVLAIRAAKSCAYSGARETDQFTFNAHYIVLLQYSVTEAQLWRSLPSVGFDGWSLLMTVWMLLKEAGGAHCCSTPMALQNWSANCNPGIYNNRTRIKTYNSCSIVLTFNIYIRQTTLHQNMDSSTEIVLNVLLWRQQEQNK